MANNKKEETSKDKGGKKSGNQHGDQEGSGSASSKGGKPRRQWHGSVSRLWGRGRSI